MAWKNEAQFEMDMDLMGEGLPTPGDLAMQGTDSSEEVWEEFIQRVRNQGSVVCLRLGAEPCSGVSGCENNAVAAAALSSKMDALTEVLMLAGPGHSLVLGRCKKLLEWLDIQPWTASRLDFVVSENEDLSRPTSEPKSSMHPTAHSGHPNCSSDPATNQP